MKTVSEPSSQIHSSNEDSNSYDDEASDAEGTENGHNSVTDLAHPKLEPPDYSLGDRSRNDSIMSPALFDTQRQRSGYGSGLFNIQGNFALFFSRLIEVSVVANFPMRTFTR